VNTETKKTVNIETLRLLNAFAIMSRRAVDLLRNQWYDRSFPEGPKEFLSRLEKARTNAFTDQLKQGNPEYGQYLHQTASAFFTQLLLSHRMLLRTSGCLELDNYVHKESFARAETVLAFVLDVANEAALGRQVMFWHLPEDFDRSMHFFP
jgi:hypothetical protein